MRTFFTCLFALTMLFAASGTMAQTGAKAELRKLLSRNGGQGAPERIFDDYDFSLRTGTYTDLVNPISLNNGQQWDDPQFVVPIGFPFNFSGDTMSTLYFVGLGGVVSQDYNLANFWVFAPYDADLIDRGSLGAGSESPVGYTLEGAAGSRIFKIEWKNAGYYDELDSLNTLNDSVNFQFWLYEGSNIMEFHYGSTQVTDSVINFFGDFGPRVGLGDWDATDVFFMIGDPAAPIPVNFFEALDGPPANGTIYRFAPKTPSSLNALRLSGAKTWPNPANGLLNVEWQSATAAPATLRLLNSMGQTLISQSGAGNRHQLDLRQLPAGAYLLVAESEGKTLRQTVLKQ